MSALISTTCPYCGVGCGVQMQQVDAHWQATGQAQHPANLGRLCVKGSALGDTVTARQRMLSPSLDGHDCNWDTALDAVAQRLQDCIAEHGPASVAFYVSGQLLTEDYYVANKLMKGFLGSANIDTNSRLCMSTAVAAHKRAFGSDTVPGCYEDLEQADCIILTGSNMAWTHPVVYQRIVAAKQQRPHMRVVLIDPRRTATADIADLHLAIKPDVDGALFEGLLAELLRREAVDRDYIAAHTEGFAAVSEDALQRWPSLPSVAEHCGLPLAELAQFVDWFATTPKTVTVFSQGINQSAQGVDKAAAILHCHLATGRVGKVGSSPFSITGQPNAMGGREVGGLANQLAAHMDFERAEDVERVRRFWRAERMAQGSGLKAVEMFRAVHRGDIKFIWIMATNPVVSLPEANLVRDALASCPTVVVSDCYADTDTLRLATIRLPAMGWSEKDGTVTNSERRISRQRAFVDATGMAKPDWWIVAQVGQRIASAGQFDYHHPAQIFREHAQLSTFENDGTRAFDIGALSHISDADYDALAPVQWPVPMGQPQGSARVFGDGRFFTAHRRARFHRLCSPSRRIALQPAAEHFLLNTGRIRDQWHTMTRTCHSPRLQQHIAEPFVELHPQDLAKLGAKPGDVLRVFNAQAACVVKARAATGQSLGQVFMPIHWTDCLASAARVDALVSAVCDPISGQPAFKQTRVQITRVPTQWHALLITRDEFSLPDCHYWSRQPMGDWQVYRLAGEQWPSASALQAQWQAQVSQWAQLQDSHGKALYWVGYRAGQAVCWLQLEESAPEIDEPWLLSALAAGDLPALHLMRGRALGGDTSRLICSCHQVREQAVMAAIAQGSASLLALGSCTRAGTGCGSCIPELKQLLSQAMVATEA